jgi:hypothetical protein
MTLTYQTHNDCPIDTSGTWGWDELDDVPYDKLVALFGPPLPGDDYKVSAVWVLRWTDGAIATISDWKTAPSYCGDEGIPAPQQTFWSLGGNDACVSARVRALLAGER